jgi:hypothetical protein
MSLYVPLRQGTQHPVKSSRSLWQCLSECPSDLQASRRAKDVEQFVCPCFRGGFPWQHLVFFHTAKMALRMDRGCARTSLPTVWVGESCRVTPLGSVDDRHVCLISGTRGGKGTGLIVPNLCLRSGSAGSGDEGLDSHPRRFPDPALRPPLFAATDNEDRERRHISLPSR